MLNRRLICAVMAGAIGSLTACTTLPVTTDANPSMSVSNCHTYTFAKEHVANADQPAAYGNPLNAERLRTAIASNLAAKGIQPADQATAECVVGYAMGSRQVFDVIGETSKDRRLGSQTGEPKLRGELSLVLGLERGQRRYVGCHSGAACCN